MSLPDFEEGGVCRAIGSHPQLLPIEFLVVVHGVHSQIGGVEIERAVRGNGIVGNVLHIVLSRHPFQQFLQLADGSHILLIHTIHQTDSFHVVQSNRGHLFQHRVHALT